MEELLNKWAILEPDKCRLCIDKKWRVKENGKWERLSLESSFHLVEVVFSASREKGWLVRIEWSPADEHYETSIYWDSGDLDSAEIASDNAGESAVAAYVAALQAIRGIRDYKVQLGGY